MQISCLTNDVETLNLYRSSELHLLFDCFSLLRGLGVARVYDKMLLESPHSSRKGGDCLPGNVM